jgi:glycosyltransferase involved in cell wall biosynthesis
MLFTDSFIHGGTERQFVETLRVLDREKYEILVGCIQRRGSFLADVEGMGLRVVEFPIRSLYRPDTVRWFLRLVRFLRAERIDLLHAFDFYTTVFAVPAARAARVPVVLASRRELPNLRSWAQRNAVRFACRLATGIVANSQASSRAFGPTGAGGGATIIPNCISLERFRPRRDRSAVRAEFGIAATAPVVGTLAALRPEKDFPTFLRAARRVAEKVPEARFVLVGEGSERPRLEQLSQELGIPSRVLFLGDRPDVADLLWAFDVFVLTSRTESFPNAILEAMAAARPVVATDVGGIPELVEADRTGLLFSAGDDEALAARLIQLLEDPALAVRMGAAGRARAESEFSPARMKQRLEALYDRALEKA